jgi:hypothetical protein
MLPEYFNETTLRVETPQVGKVFGFTFQNEIDEA